MSENERRYKQLVFSPFTIIQFFQWKQGDLIQLPIIENLPGIWKIINIDFSSHTYSFNVIIEHPSFPPVPLGTKIPSISFEIKSFTVSSPKFKT